MSKRRPMSTRDAALVMVAACHPDMSEDVLLLTLRSASSDRATQLIQALTGRLPLHSVPGAAEVLAHVDQARAVVLHNPE